MKKILTLIPVFAMLLLVSCEQHVLDYDATPVDQTTQAQIRVAYDVGVITTGAPNITRLSFNSQMVSEVSTAIGSIFPNSAAKYFVVPVGQLEISSYTGSTKDVAHYDRTINIATGRWTAFVHNLSADPLMIPMPESFPQYDPWADTCCSIQFVNLLYASDGTSPAGTLTLKARRGSGTTASPYVYTTVGTAAFGQATDYMRLNLIKSGTVWSGTETGIAFVLYDATGNLLSTFTSSNATTTYAVTGYSLTKGRNYIFHINGKRGTNYATTALRMSTITLN
jgi:hypothetical protein